MNQPFEYSGKELQIFKNATNWKKYFSKKLKPFIKGTVLEVGAGLGETTPYLINGNVKEWTTLEPDSILFESLNNRRSGTAIQGTIYNLPISQTFDTILYIDVLEHIENDVAEIEVATKHLNKGGSLIILSPSYNFLMSEFDREIGHFRRYSRKGLLKTVNNSSLKVLKLFHLETVGVLLLLINKYIFRKKYPSKGNINFWDKYIIPISKLTDRLFNYSTGKTIIGIWEKQ